MDPEEYTEEIDYKAVCDQLQRELEDTKLRLLDHQQPDMLDRVDQVLIFMSRHDPMRIYIWTATICLVLITAANLFSVAMEAKHGK